MMLVPNRIRFAIVLEIVSFIFILTGIIFISVVGIHQTTLEETEWTTLIFVMLSILLVISNLHYFRRMIKNSMNIEDLNL